MATNNDAADAARLAGEVKRLRLALDKATRENLGLKSENGNLKFAVTTLKSCLEKEKKKGEDGTVEEGEFSYKERGNDLPPMSPHQPKHKQEQGQEQHQDSDGDSNGGDMSDTSSLHLEDFFEGVEEDEAGR